MEVNTVIEGDCLEIMKGMPDSFVDTILTDPPYELTGKSGNGGFMGKKWDASGIAFNPEVWREALRVAKPGATLMAFGGTRTHHRLACAIEDAGWEIRDCVTYFHDGNQAEAALMASLDEEQLAAYLELHYPNHQMSWVYGSGIGLGHDVSKGIDKSKGAEREVVGTMKITGQALGQTKGFKGTYEGKQEYKKSWGITAPATPLAAKFDGWKSRLKPAHEIIIVAMAPMPGSYAANAEAWGVAGLWIDGGRIEAGGESLNGGAYSGETGKRNATSYEIGQKAKDFTNPTARYPANVILSGEPQTEAEFAKAGVRTSGNWNGYIKKGETKNGHLKGKKDQPYFYEGDTGTPSRYFAHCPPDTEPARLIYQAKASGKERGVYNNHPTVKSLELVKYLARLTRTPDGGIVLDPFAGSGTTALACISEGRDYILIEKEAAYADLCRQRIAEYTGAEIVPKEIETKQETVKQLGLW